MPSVSGLDYAQFYKVAVMPDVAAGLEAYQVFDGYKQGFPPEDTTTRSEAWTLGDGSVVVLVSGKTGGVYLSHVEVLP